MTDSEIIKQQEKITELLLSSKEYIVYDETKDPLFSHNRIWLSTRYCLTDFNLSLYGTVIKNYIIISWGKARVSVIINELTRDDICEKEMSGLSLFTS